MHLRVKMVGRSDEALDDIAPVVVASAFYSE